MYATEVVNLPTTMAVAHLTGGNLVVDALLDSVVRATGRMQHDQDDEEESVHQMMYPDSDVDMNDGDCGGGAHAKGRKKGIGKKAGAKGRTKGKAKPRASAAAVRK